MCRRQKYESKKLSRSGEEDEETSRSVPWERNESTMPHNGTDRYDTTMFYLGKNLRKEGTRKWVGGDKQNPRAVYLARQC